MIIWHTTQLDWGLGNYSQLEWYRYENGMIGVRLTATPLSHASYVPYDYLPLWEYLQDHDVCDYPASIPVSVVKHLFPEITCNWGFDAESTGAPKSIMDLVKSQWFDATSIGIHPPQNGRVIGWVNYGQSEDGCEQMMWSHEFDLTHHFDPADQPYQFWKEEGWTIYGHQKSDPICNRIVFTFHG